MTTSQSTSPVLQDGIKRGSSPLEPTAPPTGGGEAPAGRTEFFTRSSSAAIAPAARHASGHLARFARNQPLGAAAAAFLLLLLCAGVFAPYVAPYHPLDTNYDAILSGPSWQHWMGTDEYGRDIFSRILYGARTALMLAVSASLLGCSLGAAIGMSSAYFGGGFDTTVQRLMDIMLAIPGIVFAMVIAAVLGRNMMFGLDVNLVLAVAIPGIPNVARVLRSAALSVRAMPYVDAAAAAGFSRSRIIFGHMAPNLVAPWLVLISAFAAQAILLESALSFLGIGVVEPTPAWGLMLTGMGTQLFVEAPWLVIFPGLAVSITVFAFSLLGDALRDFLDPRLRV